MKRIIILLLFFIPAIAIAQLKKDPTEEEIKKDKLYIALQAETKAIEDKLRAISNEYNLASAEKKNDPVFQADIKKRYSETSNEIVTKLKNFISKNPDSYISLVALNELSDPQAGIEGSILAGLYKNLSEVIKKTGLGVELGKRILLSSQTSIGSVAPDFTQNDPNDKPIKLSDFRGKYVLIDFWASWCGPCRQENPNVVRAYAQFKNKNFEILGVSLDNPNAKTAWLNAIEKDNLTWPQVSDLQGWKNKVAVLYGVQSIPQNYLLDPKGVIIAKNLRGEELIRTLNKVIK